MSGTSNSHTEPTKVERREIALNHLREKARAAHASGDGLLASHLASIAIAHAQIWHKEEKMIVNLSELRWAVIFSLYWLCDSFTLHFIQSFLQDIASRESSSDLLKSLQSLTYLVEQSLEDGEEKILFLQEVNLDWTQERWTPEDDAFISLCVELAFVKSPTKNLWLKLLAKWKEKLAPSHVKNLERLCVRLKMQANALYPGARHTVTDTEKNRLEAWEVEIYQAWTLFLQCKWADLSPLLDRLVALRELKSRGALAVFDLHHNFSPFQARERDPQYIGLTRRRTISAGRQGPREYAIELFRDESFYQNSFRLWQDNSSQNAGARFACFRYAMMKEISDLRDWNLISWLGTMRQNAGACQEIVRLPSTGAEARIEFALSAFRFLLVCGDLKDSDDSCMRLSQFLDALTPANKIDLLQWILLQPPVRWYPVISALFLLTDAIPEESLVQVAQWCARYCDQPLSETSGFRIDWLSFWGDVLPYTQDDLVLFRVLKQSLLKVAQSPNFWLSDKRGALVQYMKRAPIDDAIEIADALLGVELSNEQLGYEERWATIYNAARARRELAERYQETLFRNSSSPIDRIYSQLLLAAPEEECRFDNAEAREWLKQKIRAEVAGILSRNGRGYSIVNGVRPEQLGLVSWPVTESELVASLVQCIVNEFITPVEIGRFFSLLGELVEGNHEHLDLLRPFYSQWLENLPSGRDYHPMGNSPFSSFHINVPGNEYCASSFARLAVDVCRFGDDDLRRRTASWSLRQCVVCHTDSLPVLFVLTVMLGINESYLSESELVSNTAGLLHKAFIRSNDVPEGSAVAVKIIRQIASLMKSSCYGSMFIFNHLDSPRVLQVLNMLESYVGLYCSGSIDADLRAVTAQLLVLWKKNGANLFPESLADDLEILKSDGRARVRHIANSV